MKHQTGKLVGARGFEPPTPLLPKQVRYQAALRSDRARGITEPLHDLQEAIARPSSFSAPNLP